MDSKYYDNDKSDDNRTNTPSSTPLRSTKKQATRPLSPEGPTARRRLFSEKEDEEQATVLPPIAPPTPVIESPERRRVAQWERDLRHVVERALVPLVRFTGAVAVKSRRDYIRCSMRDVVTTDAQTVTEFIDRNGALLGDVLKRYLEVNVPKMAPPFQPVQAAFDLEEMNLPPSQLAARYAHVTIERLRRLLVQDLTLTDAQKQHYADQIAHLEGLERVEERELESIFAPAWAFEVLPLSIWRKACDATTLAAMEMACAKVRRVPGCATFTLKELICSDGVSDHFAFLVAAEWLNSGDDTGSSHSQRGLRSKYMNLNQFRLQLGEQLYTCMVWFESVRARANPLLAQFAQRKRERLDRIADLNERRQVELQLDAYGSMLPKRELVYRG